MGKRFDVIAKGPTVLSSHDLAKEAAEAAIKKEALVEVWDHELQRTIFRARGGEWRWITR